MTRASVLVRVFFCLQMYPMRMATTKKKAATNPPTAFSQTVSLLVASRSEKERERERD